MKSTVSKIKNMLERITSRLKDTEEFISELNDSVVKITEAEQKKE